MFDFLLRMKYKQNFKENLRQELQDSSSEDDIHFMKNISLIIEKDDDEESNRKKYIAIEQRNKIITNRNSWSFKSK